MGEVRELVQDVDITRLHARDGSFAPNPSALALVGGRPGAATGLGFGSGSGPLRDVRFLDLDVAQAQMTKQHLMVQGSGTTPPCASGVTSLAGQRCVGICKCITWDYICNMRLRAQQRVYVCNRRLKGMVRRSGRMCHS